MFLTLTKTLTLLISLYSSFPCPDVSLHFVHLSLPKFASRSQRSLNLLPCSLSLSALGSSLFGFSEQAREAWWCTKSRILLLFSVYGLCMTFSYRLGWGLWLVQLDLCHLRTCLDVCLLDLCLGQDIYNRLPCKKEIVALTFCEVRPSILVFFLQCFSVGQIHVGLQGMVRSTCLPGLHTCTPKRGAF